MQVQFHLDQLKQENQGDISTIINQPISGSDTGFNTNYLHQAIQRTDVVMGIQDSVEIVRLLLQNGANPNEQTPTGQLPIYSAINARNPETVSLLLQRRADLDRVNQAGLDVFTCTNNLIDRDNLIARDRIGNTANLKRILEILEYSYYSQEPSPMAKFPLMVSGSFNS